MNVDENGGLDKQKITDLKQYQYKIMKYISTKRPDDESKSPKSLIILKIPIDTFSSPQLIFQCSSMLCV